MYDSAFNPHRDYFNDGNEGIKELPSRARDSS